jgi:hypothetical protein
MALPGMTTMTLRQLRMLSLACISITIILLYSNSPSTLKQSPRRWRTMSENEKFINSSNSWTDRQACRWLGICGGMNWWRTYRKDTDGPRPALNAQETRAEGHRPHDFSDAWIDPSADPDAWSKHERRLRTIPDYVLEYAPLVHLYGKEKYWPSDIAEHLENTVPKLDDDTIPNFKPTLWNLADLNKYDGARHVFLTSKDDPEADPAWMLSTHNIPGVPKLGGEREKETAVDSIPGKSRGVKDLRPQARKEGWAVATPDYNATEPEQKPIEGDADSDREEPTFEIKVPDLGAQKLLRQRRPSEVSNSSASTHVSRGSQEYGPGLRSNAPGFLICLDKGDGIVDAFWFYFYSFNEGNTVLGIRFGNHVGDWEHTMVRFHHGKPKAVYLSRHSWGSIYSYEALEKVGKRVSADRRSLPSARKLTLMQPVVYSGDGSHAHYPVAGRQDYILPLGMLHDTTSRGPLWDPVQNLKSFTYDPAHDNLRASTLNPKAPTSWFHFAGRWGDKHYDLADRRQYRFFGEYHYANGPTGPKFKHLQRTALCDSDKCNIQDYIS